MKLAKLLGAGKSFFGGQGSVSYRENKHVYLPKFNSEKNPFTLKPKEAVPMEGMANVSLVSAPKPVRVASKTQVILTPTVSPAAPQPAARPVRKAGWADKLNPFRAAEPASAAMVNAVQPEFSLDAVKVLHNDLSDAEVEVVPVKSRTSVPQTAAGRMDYLSEPAMRTI